MMEVRLIFKTFLRTSSKKKKRVQTMNELVNFKISVLPFKLKHAGLHSQNTPLPGTMLHLIIMRYYPSWLYI